MVINAALPLLDWFARVASEPDNIVKRHSADVNSGRCVAGYSERRIRINPAVPRIPYFSVNFMKAKIALATRSKGWV
jgi:hypothetical protein